MIFSLPSKCGSHGDLWKLDANDMMKLREKKDEN